MADGRSFLDDLPTMDKGKATRMIVWGILLAIIFGCIWAISGYLNSNAGSLLNLLEHEKLMNYNNGYITYEDYLRQGTENYRVYYWLLAQDIFIQPIARVGGYIAAFLVALGFLSLGMNNSIEEKARNMYLIIGFIVTFAVVLSVLGMGIGIAIT